MKKMPAKRWGGHVLVAAPAIKCVFRCKLCGRYFSEIEVKGAYVTYLCEAKSHTGRHA